MYTNDSYRVHVWMVYCPSQRQVLVLDGTHCLQTLYRNKHISTFWTTWTKYVARNWCRRFWNYSWRMFFVVHTHGPDFTNFSQIVDQSLFVNSGPGYSKRLCASSVYTLLPCGMSIYTYINLRLECFLFHSALHRTLLNTFTFALPMFRRI